MFHKKECSSKFCKIHKKTPVSEPLVKLPGRGKKKRVRYQVFSCEFCKIFKSIYLQNIYRRLLVKKNDQRRDFFSNCVLFYEYSRFAGQQGEREAIYLTPLYQFHPFHRRRAHLWFQSAIRLTTKLRTLRGIC